MVRFVDGESPDAILSGFTITGAFLNEESGSGAVAIIEANPTIVGCIFTENQGSGGAGIRVEFGGVSVQDSQFYQNHAILSYDGYALAGGIYAYASEVEIVRNRFAHNTSVHDGGAIWLSESWGNITNNLFNENLCSDSDSAAIESFYTDDLLIANNVFVNNEGDGTADLYLNEGYFDIRNNIFAGSVENYSITDYSYELNYAYNDIIGYATAGFSSMSNPIGSSGNISADPEFLNSDFTLQNTSPCIDAGDPATEYADLDGTRNDMGMYGGPLAPSLIDSDLDGMPDSWEIRYGLDPAINDADGDLDGDGLSNLEEYELGTSPANVDSDYDGVGDFDEVAQGSDPTDPSDHRPTANAGDDITSTVGELVQLDGSQSFDPNGDALTYAWTLVRVPEGSELTQQDIDGSTTAVASFIPDVRGEFEVELRVMDAGSQSAASNVVVMALGTLLVPEQYLSIRSAVDEAFSGETVLVGPGTYYEHVVISKSVFLLGNGDASSVIVDADNYDAPLSIHWTGEAEVTMQNLTLTHGAGSMAYYYSYGGGLAVLGSSVNLINCRIVENTAESGGGVGVVEGSDLFITDSLIQGNVSTYGSAGLQGFGSNVEVVRTRMLTNHGQVAGAIGLSGSTLSVSNSLIQDNQSYTTDVGAGGILLDSSSGELINNVFTENYGRLSADLYLAYTYDVAVMNNIFIAGQGFVAFGLYSGNTEITYNDVFAYPARYAGDLVDPTGTEGNIATNPRFVAFSRDHNPSNDDFHLRRNSACVNTGNPDASYNDLNASRNDMGMFGGPDAP